MPFFLLSPTPPNRQPPNAPASAWRPRCPHQRGTWRLSPRMLQVSPNALQAASGASCPQSRANTIFQTHRDEDDAPEKESAPSFPLSRPSRCCTVVMVVVVISNKNRHKIVIDSIDPIWDPKGVRNRLRITSPRFNFLMSPSWGGICEGKNRRNGHDYVRTESTSGGRGRCACDRRSYGVRGCRNGRLPVASSKPLGLSSGVPKGDEQLPSECLLLHQIILIG